MSLAVAIGLAALLTSLVGVKSAAAQVSIEQQLRRNLALRLRDRADELERDWKSGEEFLRVLIAKHDYGSLKTILGLEEDDQEWGGDIPTDPIVGLLRDFTRKDREAEENTWRPTRAGERPARTPDQLLNGGYAECVLYRVKAALERQVADLRDIGAKVATLSRQELDRRIEEVLGPIDVFGPPCSTPPNEPIPYFLQHAELSTKWASRCTVDDGVLEDGSAELYQPSVAALLYDDGIHGSLPFCTGTLIAPNVVLTAAHCFCQTGARAPGGRFFQSYGSCVYGSFERQGRPVSPVDPNHLAIFLQHVGVLDIGEIILHRDFAWNSMLPRADLALVVLKTPVVGIEPSTVNTIRSAEDIVGTGVGFGFSNPIDAQGRPVSAHEIAEKAGLKLMSRVATSRCGTVERSRKLICWDYRLRQGATKLGSTCNGDSGGPLFVEYQGKSYLAGVASAGDRSCRPGGRSYDFDVFAFRNWIARVLYAFPTTAPASKLKNPRQIRCRFYKSVLKGEETVDNIGKGAARLRVSINCTPTGEAIGLSLTKAGSDKPACQRPPALTTAVSCEVATTQRDAWRLSFAAQGAPDCQVVATTFD